MSEQKKVKHKIRREPKNDDIVKIDDKTFQIKDYMIYNSDKLGFICDCKDWMFKNHECKHILAVKEQFS